jgi:hypothetical protein
MSFISVLRGLLGKRQSSTDSNVQPAKDLSLIVDINGAKVYSDLTATGVQTFRVSFKDGSWCNVASGEIVNNGSGRIVMTGAPLPKSRQHNIHIKGFSSSGAHVHNVKCGGNLTITNE